MSKFNIFFKISFLTAFLLVFTSFAQINTNVDFIVNDDDNTYQTLPDINMNFSGELAVVWSDMFYDYSTNIKLQIYDQNGDTLSPNLNVNDLVNDTWRTNPAVAINDSGLIIVAWEDYLNGNADIFIQIYNKFGVKKGTNIKVNDDLSFKNQKNVAIDILSDNEIIITWTDERNNNSDIYYQIYNFYGVPIGSNQLIYQDSTNNSQKNPDVKTLSNGNYIISWLDNKSGDWEIYFKKYNNLGIALTTEIRVNDTTGVTEEAVPCIAADQLNNFTICWHDERNGNSDIYGQVFDYNNNAIGSNFKINTDFSTREQKFPSITNDLNGFYVILWQDTYDDSSKIVVQKFNDNFVPIGLNSTFKVNKLLLQDETRPKIASNLASELSVAWVDTRLNNYNIFAQRLNSDLSQDDEDFKVNYSYGTARNLASVAAVNDSGQFVISWQDDREGNYEIYYQLFDKNNKPININRKANESNSKIQQVPVLAMDDFGNFQIAWLDNRAWYYYDVFFQRFNQNGNPIGPNINVADNINPCSQFSPDIANNGNGDFIIVFADKRYDDGDIMFQRYDSSGVAIDSNIIVNDDLGSETQSSPKIDLNKNGDFVIAWNDKREVVYTDIYMQRYDYNAIKLGQNFKVNGENSNRNCSIVDVSLEQNGNFIITWVEGSKFIFQYFDSNGQPIGQNEQLNENYSNAYPRFPQTAMNSSSQYICVWQDSRYGTWSEPDILGQRINANGNLVGMDYVLVQDNLTMAQNSPHVDLSNSKMILAWADNRRSDKWDIYAKITNWSWPGIPTAINRNQISPNEFKLLQNYPNPFNPKTKIDFYIAKAQITQLNVYDILGHKTTTLFSKKLNPGNYSIDFDATNFSSGIYFYELISGSNRQVKKMIFLK